MLIDGWWLSRRSGELRASRPPDNSGCGDVLVLVSEDGDLTIHCPEDGAFYIPSAVLAMLVRDAVERGVLKISVWPRVLGHNLAIAGALCASYRIGRHDVFNAMDLFDGHPASGG